MKPYSGSPTNQHAPPTLRKMHMGNRVVIWLQNPDLKSALTLNSRALWPPAPERFGIQHYRLEQQYLSLYSLQIWCSFEVLFDKSKQNSSFAKERNQSTY